MPVDGLYSMKNLVYIEYFYSHLRPHSYAKCIHNLALIIQGNFLQNAQMIIFQTFTLPKQVCKYLCYGHLQVKKLFFIMEQDCGTSTEINLAPSLRNFKNFSIWKKHFIYFMVFYGFNFFFFTYYSLEIIH